MKYSGTCLCGEIKFEFEGEFDSFYLCHCKYCQKDTGSAHAANLFSKHGKLIWIAGSEKVKTFVLPSTRHTKSFCTECGSALPNQQNNDALLVVPAGCLDVKVEKRPDAHIFCASRASWDTELHTIKSFGTYPS